MLRTFPIFLIFCLSLLSTNGISQDLDHIRNQYQLAIKDEAACKALIEKLRIKEKEIQSVELAYLGTLETIWAKYVNNPFSKLKTFKKGKNKIEDAVKQSPNNVEILYLRLSVQKNAPSFLGYNSNIKEDTEFIKKNLHQIESAILQKHIEAILNE